ncbi:MAG: NAD(+)/NADH kinase [Candidatus Komeilibacteria bacterium]|nr:NAD(+)/NADH kinase [Candidatus Komeilibacteria bacterium]
MERIVLDEPRLLLHFNPEHEASARLAGSLASFIDNKNPSLIVSLGGDGAMLKAVGLYGDMGLPFLGLNTGSKGFLLNHENDFSRLVGRPLVVRELPLLQAVCQTDRGQSIHFGLNEAWVERDSGQNLTIGLACARGSLELKGDGMVVATAVGSWGLARNACRQDGLFLSSDCLRLAGINLDEEYWGAIPNPLDIAFTGDVNLEVISSQYRPARAFVDGGMPIANVRSVRLGKKRPDCSVAFYRGGRSAEANPLSLRSKQWISSLFEVANYNHPDAINMQ